jgi:hypothetical protein
MCAHRIPLPPALAALAAMPLPAQFTVSPQSLDFGQVAVGQFAERSFTVSSDSFTAQLRATASDATFTITPATATASSTPRTFTVRFTPNAVRTFSARIRIRLIADNIQVGELAVGCAGITPPEPAFTGCRIEGKTGICICTTRRSIRLWGCSISDWRH